MKPGVQIVSKVDLKVENATAEQLGYFALLYLKSRRPLSTGALAQALANDHGPPVKKFAHPRRSCVT